jgi:hypothetical protein
MVRTSSNVYKMDALVSVGCQQTSCQSQKTPRNLAPSKESGQNTAIESLNTKNSLHFYKFMTNGRTT